MDELSLTEGWMYPEVPSGTRCVRRLEQSAMQLATLLASMRFCLPLGPDEAELKLNSMSDQDQQDTRRKSKTIAIEVEVLSENPES